MTTESHADHQSNPPLGLGCTEGLGPLPEPFGWLRDGMPDGGLAFQKHALEGFAALVHSTMPVYSHAQMREAVAAEHEVSVRVLADVLEMSGAHRLHATREEDARTLLRLARERA